MLNIINSRTSDWYRIESNRMLNSDNISSLVVFYRLQESVCAAACI